MTLFLSLSLYCCLCERIHELCGELQWDEREDRERSRGLKVGKWWAEDPVEITENNFSADFRKLLPLFLFSLSLLCLDAESRGLLVFCFFFYLSRVTMVTSSGSCAGTRHDGTKREEERLIWKGGRWGWARGETGGVCSPRVEERNQEGGQRGQTDDFNAAPARQANAVNRVATL